MHPSDKWRGFIVGAILLLLALTACQATEPATTGADKPPAATTTAQTATPTVVPSPTTSPTAPPAEDAAPPPSPTPSPVQLEAADPPPLPFGFTREDFAFKGDPNAPVVIIEFSDYQ